ncbi:hypothetical protein AS156_28140 [Bradyrhizobium macuxiense]|uniref:Uncharacterized protein n=1 Tax=Bradyrhizobium macuxiense TaxID=1755647 RepID=A0A109K4F9_9BRAD|nr:hypothetical protein AS156_28140 [Bradyrhizobium macuxiense]
MMERDRCEMQRDQRQQHIGEEDVAVLVGPRRRLVGRGDLRHVEQAKEARIVRRVRAGMRPAQHRHQDGDGIERDMAEAGRDPLPAGRLGRQLGCRVEAAPQQPQHSEEQHQIADIGVDRTVEQAVRPRREVVHPPAIGQHADDGDAEHPVERAGERTPACGSITDHGRSALPACADFACRSNGLP